MHQIYTTFRRAIYQNSNKTYNVTTCNVFLRAEMGKNRFFPELSLVFFKSKPKMQFKYAK